MIDQTTKHLILQQFLTSLPDSPPPDGILLVDKPSGPTSHDIVSAIRRHYGYKVGKNPKVGHAGTLDPLASGLLIVLIGSATKRAKEFEGLDKTYEVEVVLGQERDTYDAEGSVTFDAYNQPESSTRLSQLNHNQIENNIPTFIGTQLQKVPAFSAVKRDGQALYKKAHQDHPIADKDLPTKQITIFGIDLMRFEPAVRQAADEMQHYPRIWLKVHCSKGTYIRSLIHDLGLKLGVGAYVSQLRRTTVGPYHVHN
jgi:tRNA pseudouridine55 synthase